MCFNIDLSLSFSFVRMFLTGEQYFTESKKSFDLRLVRLFGQSMGAVAFVQHKILSGNR